MITLGLILGSLFGFVVSYCIYYIFVKDKSSKLSKLELIKPLDQKIEMLEKKQKQIKSGSAKKASDRFNRL